MAVDEVAGKTGSRWRVRVSRNGQKFNKTYRTKSKAKSEEANVIKAMDDGTFHSEIPSKQLTFEEAYHKWIDEIEVERLQLSKGNDAKTKRAKTYISDKKNKIPAFRGNFKKFKSALNTIGVSDLASYRNQRRAMSIAENTIKREMNIISIIFKHAIGEWGMENLTNPVPKLRPPPKTPSRDRRLVGNEESIILSEAAKDTRHWFLPLVKWQMFVGLRVGETASITPDDIDLENRLLDMPFNKMDYARKVPLSKEAIEILASFMWGKERVFHVAEGSMSAAWLTFKNDLMNRGLIEENLTLHDLRHEATSRYFEKRRPDGTALLQIYEVRQITGHKTLDVMFNTYVNKFDPSLVVAIDGF